MNEMTLEEKIKRAADKNDDYVIHFDDVTLADTIPLMLSKDYKERLLAEYLQLCIRWKKIEYAVSKRMANVGMVAASIDNTLRDLNRQAGAMSSYMYILKQRLRNEDIAIQTEFD